MDFLSIINSTHIVYYVARIFYDHFISTTSLCIMIFCFTACRSFKSGQSGTNLAKIENVLPLPNGAELGMIMRQ